jgi:HEAT repeat protein
MQKEIKRLGNVIKIAGLIIVASSSLSTVCHSQAKDVTRLINQMKNENAEISDPAFDALVKIGKPAVGPLIACLKDEESHVRYYAAAALGQIGDKEAFEPLIACLKEKSSFVREAAVRALIKIDGRRAVEPLIASLKDPDPDVSWSAGRSLSEIGQPAVAQLITCMSDKQDYVRAVAAWTLGKIGDKGAVDPLIACLKDDALIVRENVAESLGKIADMRAFESLIGCLQDREPRVRRSIALTLVKIGGSQGVEPLIGCLKDEDVLVREAAVRSLSESSDKRAVEPLVACLKDRSPLVRESTVRALTKIDSNCAIEPLIACLGDEDASVRRSVALALIGIGSRRAVRNIAGVLPDWEAMQEICRGLEKLGWLPETEAEQTYFWIGKRDRKSLDSRWEQTKRVLLNDITSASKLKIENAVYAFISLGKEETIDELIRILDREGNREIAETYLNCGSSRLGEAARSWARTHGYSISSGSGSGMATWGRW